MTQVISQATQFETNVNLIHGDILRVRQLILKSGVANSVVIDRSQRDYTIATGDRVKRRVFWKITCQNSIGVSWSMFICLNRYRMSEVQISMPWRNRKTTMRSLAAFKPSTIAREIIKARDWAIERDAKQEAERLEDKAKEDTSIELEIGLGIEVTGDDIVATDSLHFDVIGGDAVKLSIYKDITVEQAVAIARILGEVK